MRHHAMRPLVHLIGALAGCAPVGFAVEVGEDPQRATASAAHPRDDEARGGSVVAPVPDADELEVGYDPIHADADAEYLDDDALEVPAAPPPHAAPVGCGAVLTRSTRLRGDIGPCPADALVIGADDITLDCGGHRIRGSGDHAGIVLDGRASVVVKNCRIDGFGTGIRMHDTIGNTVTANRITSTDYADGVDLMNAVGDVVARNRFIGLAAHVDGHVVTFAENHARGDTPYGTSVFAYGYNPGVRIRDNDLEGFVVLVSPNGTRVDHNRMQEGGLDLELDGARGTRIDHNVLRKGNGGVSVLSSEGNRIEDNVVTRVDTFAFYVWGGSSRNLLRDNRADDNGEFGFALNLGATENVLDDNEACGNGDVDLLVDGVTGNRFVDNDFCTERFE